MAVLVKTCCCGCSLRKGVMILGIFGLVSPSILVKTCCCGCSLRKGVMILGIFGLKSNFDLSSSMAVLVKTCCCGCSLRSRVVILGIIGLLGSVYLIYQQSNSIKVYKYREDNAYEFELSQNFPFSKKYFVGDYKLIQYQILQTNITRTVWQTIRRFTNEIFKILVKTLCCGLSLRKGVMIHAIFGLIPSAFSIYHQIYLIKVCKQLEENADELSQNLHFSIKHILAIVRLAYVFFTFEVISLLVTLLLLGSCCSGDKCLAFPWLGWSIFKLFFTFGVMMFYIAVWNRIYFIMVVYSYINALREDPSGTSAGFSPSLLGAINNPFQ
ncbi:hypothetical protein pdam_00024070 [Pocillopora damicornis]|uniref:Uncharacterized protein n=1 Tax=Pocillopora damicornis TaxID=46731 RepID=A0A3M6UU64_POCDA|nr:hypothetical protein pdam_00024070 [Pocillopora damicornis]